MKTKQKSVTRNLKVATLIGVVIGTYMAAQEPSAAVMFEPDHWYYRQAQMDFVTQVIGSVIAVCFLSLGFTWFKDTLSWKPGD